MSAYSYPTAGTPAGVVDGYALTIEDGPPVTSLATNASTGAVIEGLQRTAATSVAAAQSGANVVVTWTDQSGSGTVQYIERSPDGSAWTEIATPSSEDETYTDTNPGAGTWRYRMRSGVLASAGRSPYSNTATVTVRAAPVLTVTPTTGTAPLAFLVSWTAVTGATQYELLYRQNPGDPWGVVNTTTGTSLNVNAEGPFDGYVAVRVSQPFVGGPSNVVAIDFN